MLYLLINSIQEVDDDLFLEEVTGQVIKQKKDTGNSFLVLFGINSCQLCKDSSKQIAKYIQEEDSSIDVFYIDCQKEENKVACGMQYEIKSYPSFHLFNSNAIKGRKPQKYTDNDITSSKIVIWAEQNAKKPYILMNSIQQLKEEIEKHPEFIALLTNDDEVRPIFSKIAKKNGQTKMLIKLDFTDEDATALQSTKLDEAKGEQFNLIVCSISCKKYQGEVNNDEIDSWLTEQF